MTGVPLFQIGSQIVAGVDVEYRWIRLLVWPGWLRWEHIEWFPSVFKPINSDARAMLAIARGGK